MLRKFIYYLLLLPITAGAQIPIGIGQWRTHVPYQNATSVTDAIDRIYVSANVFFFSCDKMTGELTRYDKVSGLSDVGVNFVSYNKFDSTLLVVYENANIDLIRQNNIINISDIKRKQIVGDKKIYSSYFMGHLAYLSCGFGVVVLDLQKREVKDTYRIGSNGADKKVFSFTSDDLNFYAATEEGLKIASMTSPNLANYSEWTFPPGIPKGISKNVVQFNVRIFANVKDTLYVNDGSTWNYYYSNPQWSIRDLTVADSNMTICESNETTAFVGRVMIVKNDYVCCDSSFSDPVIRDPYQAFVAVDNTVWAADFLNGLLKISNNGTEIFFPHGLPSSVNAQNMSAERNILAVAPGGAGPTEGDNFTREGMFSFKDEWWNSYNQYSHPELKDSFLSVYSVAVDPYNDIIYYGSWTGGLAELSDNHFTIYNENTSILEDVEGDPGSTRISGLTFDRYGNLWMTSFGSPKPIVVKKADGTWQSFLVAGIDEYGLTQIITDDYDQKWITIPKSNNQGILVFGTDENFANPVYKVIKSGLGSGNLPTNEVLCLEKDLEGEIWAGTAQGVAVFYCPSSVLTEQGCEAQQIIVTQNGVAGYLLETERVNTIAIDGANRKWVGTNNGVFLLSPDGTQQIAYYTVDNSPLLSNSIIDIAINHQTGEVFIATSKGVVSIRGEATVGGEENSDVLVFPNPVKESYEGPIAIKGLADNSNVKITDVDGMLFYETTALGGQAVWDGKNYNGERAKTGVYLIFSSNEDGSSKQITKLLIIN